MAETIIKLTDTPLPADYIIKRYGISRTTLWRWRKLGLECVTVGAKIFVKESALVAFMDKQNLKNISGEKGESDNARSNP